MMMFFSAPPSPRCAERGNVCLSVCLDVHEGATTPNDLSASLSPSLHRRTTPSSSKRPRLSTGGPLEYSNHLPTGTADLLSPNHRAQSADETSNSNNNHQRQPRKLDPRTCSQCGKVLFSDKTHLLHCQTHVRNERQCWICGVNDDDIKKHILTEHGNQKFSSAGFKVDMSRVTNSEGTTVLLLRLVPTL